MSVLKHFAKPPDNELSYDVLILDRAALVNSRYPKAARTFNEHDSSVPVEIPESYSLKDLYKQGQEGCTEQEESNGFLQDT